MTDPGFTPDLFVDSEPFGFRKSMEVRVDTDMSRAGLRSAGAAGERLGQQNPRAMSVVVDLDARHEPPRIMTIPRPRRDGSPVGVRHRPVVDDLDEDRVRFGPGPTSTVSPTVAGRRRAPCSCWRFVHRETRSSSASSGRASGSSQRSISRRRGASWKGLRRQNPAQGCEQQPCPTVSADSAMSPRSRRLRVGSRTTSPGAGATPRGYATGAHTAGTRREHADRAPPAAPTFPLLLVVAGC